MIPTLLLRRPRPIGHHRLLQDLDQDQDQGTGPNTNQGPGPNTDPGPKLPLGKVVCPKKWIPMKKNLESFLVMLSLSE